MKENRNLCAAIFVSILFFVLNSTIIAGNKFVIRVIEAGTGLPIPSALVRYSGYEDMKKSSHSVTDSSGFASLDILTAKFYYEIACNGYEKASGYAMSSDNLIVRMHEAVYDIDRTIVTGISRRPVKLSPVLTGTLSGQKLSSCGYSDIQHALSKEIPGFNIRKSGFGSDLSLQGLDARHVLFLLDGERITGDMAGNPDYERFNIYSIERIEIVKGASGVLHGSRASGAVVNLISKKPVKPVSVRAGLRYGQMNMLNFPNSSPKDFWYMFRKNSDKPNIDAWLSAGFAKGNFSSQTDFLYGSSDAFYMFPKKNVKKWYPKSINEFLSEDVSVTSAITGPPLGIDGNEHVSISQKFYYENGKNIDLQVYGRYFKMNTYDLLQDMLFNQSYDFSLGMKASYAYKNYFKVTASFHSDFYDRFKRHERVDVRFKVYESRIIHPKIIISSDYFDKYKLLSGVEYFSDNLTSDRFNGDGSFNLKTRGLDETELFFTCTREFSKNNNFSCGIRTSFSKIFGFMWMPMAVMKFNLTGNTAMRLNYSGGYRAPGIKELFFNWDNMGMFMIRGNENLKPERNNYFSFSTEYDSGKFFILSNFYVNLFSEKIEGVWKVYDMQYNFEYVNLPSQNIYGADLMLKYVPFPGFAINASYSYVKVGEYGNLNFNQFSPHTAVLGLNYKIMWKYGQTEFSVSGSFTGKKFFDVQDRLVMNGYARDAYFRTVLPAYMLADFVAGHTFDEKYKISLGINNLSNYVPETLGSGITMFNVPSTPGRRAFVKCEIMF